VTNEVFNALGTSIQNRSELEPISLELQDTNFIKAKSAIQIYKALEKKRDSAEETIRNILSTEKTNSAITDIDHSLAEQEETLLARQNALCGNYYQDPGSLLYQKWKEYQTAVIASDSNADSLLQEYTALEEERKSLDAKINLLKEQRSIPAAAAERNIETLTLSSIQEQIQALNETKATEASLAGVDWKKTASAAASLALTSAGYILSQTLVG
jgi:Rad3-related DNA helicase